MGAGLAGSFEAAMKKASASFGTSKKGAFVSKAGQKLFMDSVANVDDIGYAYSCADANIGGDSGKANCQDELPKNYVGDNEKCADKMLTRMSCGECATFLIVNQALTDISEQIERNYIATACAIEDLQQDYLALNGLPNEDLDDMRISFGCQAAAFVSKSTPDAAARAARAKYDKEIADPSLSTTGGFCECPSGAQYKAASSDSCATLECQTGTKVSCSENFFQPRTSQRVECAVPPAVAGLTDFKALCPNQLWFSYGGDAVFDSKNILYLQIDGGQPAEMCFSSVWGAQHGIINNELFRELDRSANFKKKLLWTKVDASYKLLTTGDGYTTSAFKVMESAPRFGGDNVPYDIATILKGAVSYSETAVKAAGAYCLALLAYVKDNTELCEPDATFTDFFGRTAQEVKIKFWESNDIDTPSSPQSVGDFLTPRITRFSNDDSIFELPNVKITRSRYFGTVDSLRMPDKDAALKDDGFDGKSPTCSFYLPPIYTPKVPVLEKADLNADCTKKAGAGLQAQYLPLNDYNQFLAGKFAYAKGEKMSDLSMLEMLFGHFYNLLVYFISHDGYFYMTSAKRNPMEPTFSPLPRAAYVWCHQVAPSFTGLCADARGAADSSSTGHAAYKKAISDQVEENAPGVGGWGGLCRCPSGSLYPAGDNNDYCGSLACDGGYALCCGEDAAACDKFKDDYSKKAGTAYNQSEAYAWGSFSWKRVICAANIATDAIPPAATGYPDVAFSYPDIVGDDIKGKGHLVYHEVAYKINKLLQSPIRIDDASNAPKKRGKWSIAYNGLKPIGCKPSPAAANIGGDSNGCVGSATLQQMMLRCEQADDCDGFTWRTIDAKYTDVVMSFLDTAPKRPFQTLEDDDIRKDEEAENAMRTESGACFQAAPCSGGTYPYSGFYMRFDRIKPEVPAGATGDGPVQCNTGLFNATEGASTRGRYAIGGPNDAALYKPATSAALYKGVESETYHTYEKLQDGDCPGNDINGENLNTGDVSECNTRCDSLSNCKGYTRGGVGGNVCIFKTASCTKATSSTEWFFYKKGDAAQRIVQWPTSTLDLANGYCGAMADKQWNDESGASWTKDTCTTACAKDEDCQGSVFNGGRCSFGYECNAGINYFALDGRMLTLQCERVPRTCAFEGRRDVYLAEVPGVGGWGGYCTCPSGKTYPVGDNNDYGASLACEGGVATEVYKSDDSDWVLMMSKKQVFCAGNRLAPAARVGTNDKPLLGGISDGALGAGTWGGRCACPNGAVYYVADKNDACGSLACTGGTPVGACTMEPGPWSRRWVDCRALADSSTPLAHDEGRCCWAKSGDASSVCGDFYGDPGRCSNDWDTQCVDDQPCVIDQQYGDDAALGLVPKYLRVQLGLGQLTKPWSFKYFLDNFPTERLTAAEKCPSTQCVWNVFADELSRSMAYFTFLDFNENVIKAFEQVTALFGSYKLGVLDAKGDYVVGYQIPTPEIRVPKFAQGDVIVWNTELSSLVGCNVSAATTPLPPSPPPRASPPPSPLPPLMRLPAMPSPAPPPPYGTAAYVKVCLGFVARLYAYETKYKFTFKYWDAESGTDAGEKWGYDYDGIGVFKASDNKITHVTTSHTYYIKFTENGKMDATMCHEFERPIKSADGQESESWWHLGCSGSKIEFEIWRDDDNWRSEGTHTQCVPYQYSDRSHSRKCEWQHGDYIPYPAGGTLDDDASRGRAVFYHMYVTPEPCTQCGGMCYNEVISMDGTMSVAFPPANAWFNDMDADKPHSTGTSSMFPFDDRNYRAACFNQDNPAKYVYDKDKRGPIGCKPQFETFCANENEKCECKGGTVYYGRRYQCQGEVGEDSRSVADQQKNTKYGSSGIYTACYNDQDWESPTRTVFQMKIIGQVLSKTGTTTCSNAAFGSDPAHHLHKHCICVIDKDLN
uniref:Uncharacterized protein n=1 Tax=Calcidiscus leptoporus TaxID=127549 RepID=A0A7S0NSK8_9EUKA